jgi:hypothetical protein
VAHVHTLTRWSQRRDAIVPVKASRGRVVPRSSPTEALLTSHCALHDNIQAAVIAHEAPATRRIWGMSKKFVEESPLKAMAGIGNQQIRFGRSVISLATAGSPHALRSGRHHCLHFSEQAFYEKAGVTAAAMQTIPDRGFTICIKGFQEQSPENLH